jgi:nucleoid-associated protein YgaU
VNVSLNWSTASRTAAVARTVSTTTPTRSYTVVSGDTLFAIAARALGSGDKYWTLFNLNKNRLETGGERFTNPDLIRTGWTLAIPTSAASATTESSSSSSSSSSAAT